MDAINNVVSRHLGSEGAQTSLLAQGAGWFRPAADGTMQILYDDYHWVAVAKVNGKVLVADNLDNPISERISRQLKQLFPSSVTDDGGLPVTVLK